MVHGLDDERITGRPVVPIAGDQPDAHGVAPGHEPIAVMLDLVNPVGAGRGLVGGGWQARLYEGGSTQHAAYLGCGGKESKSPGTKYRATYWGDASAACALLPLSRGQTPLAPRRGFPYLEPAKKMTEYWVFQDKSFKRACIHRSNCSVRQGALNPDRSEGTWHGAFPTYGEARRTAAGLSPQKRAQLNCRLCHPQDF